MKNFISFFVCLLTMCMSVSAAQGSNISKEDYDKLPPALQAQIDSCLSVNPVKQQLVETSEYVQIGHQIGVAVNETLQAIEETTVRLSETKIGKIAIFIVIWKVLAKDFINIFLGIIIMILCIISGVKFCKRYSELNKDGDRFSDGQAIEIFLRIIMTLVLFITGVTSFIL